jgi:hypothetical protein
MKRKKEKKNTTIANGSRNDELVSKFSVVREITHLERLWCRLESNMTIEFKGIVCGGVVLIKVTELGPISDLVSAVMSNSVP